MSIKACPRTGGMACHMSRGRPPPRFLHFSLSLLGAQLLEGTTKTCKPRGYVLTGKTTLCFLFTHPAVEAESEGRQAQNTQQITLRINTPIDLNIL